MKSSTYLKLYSIINIIINLFMIGMIIFLYFKYDINNYLFIPTIFLLIVKIIINGLLNLNVFNIFGGEDSDHNQRLELLQEISQKDLERQFYNELLNESSLVSRTDDKGKIIHVNSKFQEISGYRQDELLGKDHNLLNSGKHPKEFWQRMYEVVLKYKGTWFGVVTNRKKDGTLYIVKSWIRGEFDKTGKLLGMSSVRQDVTDVVKNAEEIQEKNIILNHSNYIARHDLRNPIIAINRIFPKIRAKISDELLKPIKCVGDFNQLIHGLDQLNTYYNSLYEFTNITKPGAELETKQVNLEEALRKHLKSTAYGENVIIKNLDLINCSEYLMINCFDNLIRNAIRYNDSVTKKVEISREGSNLIILDNGRGMSNAEFNSFTAAGQRGDNKESGSGLGLPITKIILKIHGFELDCEDVESGTKMVIKNVK